MSADPEQSMFVNLHAHCGVKWSSWEKGPFLPIRAVDLPRGRYVDTPLLVLGYFAYFTAAYQGSCGHVGIQWQTRSAKGWLGLILFGGCSAREKGRESEKRNQQGIVVVRISGHYILLLSTDTGLSHRNLKPCK